MHVLSVVLLTVWLMVVGALSAGWIAMTGYNLLSHTFGVLTFFVGLVILLIELWYIRTHPEIKRY